MILPHAAGAPGETPSESRVVSTYRRYLSSRWRVQAQSEAAGAGRGTIVVGGGSGFIGGVLTRSLQSQGYRVTILSRSSGPGRLTWDDLAGQGFPEHTRAVINLAGQNILAPFTFWTESFKTLVRTSRVGTAQSLVRAIQAAPRDRRPPVYVQVTGVGFYHYHTPKAQDERSPGGDHDFWARLVQDWEAAAQVPEDLGVRQVFIRSGVVLGRQGGMIQQLFWPFFFGVGGRMGEGSQWMPWIHVKDLVGIIEHAIKDDQVKGVLNGTSPEPITNLEFVKTFGQALSRPTIIPVPAFVFRMMFGSERADIILNGQQVVPRRTLDSGYAYKYGSIQAACEEFSAFSYKE